MSSPRTITIGKALSTREREELFCSDEFLIRSRSGLHPTESIILQNLAYLGKPSKLLIIENRSGVSPLICSEKNPQAEVVAFHHDCYYTTQLEENLRHNRHSGVQVVCSSDLPGAEGEFDAVIIMVTQSIPSELVAEYLQEAHKRLVVGGYCWVASEPKNKVAGPQVKKVFGACSRESSKKAVLFRAKKKAPLKKWKNFEAQTELSLPGGMKIPLVTMPGIFSHRRVDGGAQALAEALEVLPGDQIIDMGCGNGAIGISAYLRAEGCTLKLMDSSARALECARTNAQRNDIERVSFELSATGGDVSESCTLFLGNPPYYGDTKIAQVFIDTAHAVLKKGGRGYLVAKSMDWNREYAETLFSEVEEFGRRGYRVLRMGK